jgi:hypothetical protein
LRDHLLKGRPRFRKALALQGHVRDRQRSLDMMSRLPLRRSRDYDVVDRVRHLDERTFQLEVRGRHLCTATPNDLRLEAVDVMFQPLGSPCLVLTKSTTAP